MQLSCFSFKYKKIIIGGTFNVLSMYGGTTAEKFENPCTHTGQHNARYKHPRLEPTIPATKWPQTYALRPPGLAQSSI
jgi:hypothetical protein